MIEHLDLGDKHCNVNLGDQHCDDDDDQHTIFDISKVIHRQQSLLSSVVTPHINDLTDPDLSTPHHLIYKASRFHEKHSPNCLFLPSSDFLFKMMRACIGAKSPEELWIYNSDISIRPDHKYESWEPWLEADRFDSPKKKSSSRSRKRRESVAGSSSLSKSMTRTLKENL